MVKDLTRGNPRTELIKFSLPLLGSILFQQLYNIADSLVAGKFIGDEALAAVGNAYEITLVYLAFAFGCNIGCSVILAQMFGAKQFRDLKTAVSTTYLASGALCALLMLLGFTLSPSLMQLIRTPADILEDSQLYLNIYTGGLFFLFYYNISTGIFSALGDSRTPFVFLVASSLTNIAMDIWFVAGLHMGVAGVAWATIIAQAVSAVLVLAVLMRTDSCVRVELRRLRVHWDMLKKIVRVGIPAALQMAVTAFSNVFVQSYINHFGADCMSGWTAYTKIDQLMFLPMQSLALSATTFVGQNLGAGDTPRAQQGVRRALGISLAVTAVLMVPVLVFAPQLTAFFNRKAEVVAYGTLLLRYISPFYLLCCINQIYSGALRGAGNSQVPMVIMLGSFVVFRQIYLYIVSHFITNTLLPLAMGYPAGWLVCSAATLLYYRRAALGRQRLVEDN